MCLFLDLFYRFESFRFFCLGGLFFHWLGIGNNLIGGLLFLPGLGARDLGNPDEPRYAEIAREMLIEPGPEALLVPRLNGQIYSEKPPLLFWCIGLGATLLGRLDEVTAYYSQVLGFRPENEDAVIDAVLRQYGVHRAETTEELIDIAACGLSGALPKEVTLIGVAGDPWYPCET